MKAAAGIAGILVLAAAAGCSEDASAPAPKPAAAPAPPVRGAPLASVGAATTRPADAAQDEPPFATKEGTTTVPFHALSGFRYDPPPLDYDADGRPIPPKKDYVPKRIRALSGRRVAIDGFIVPFDFADGACTKFALLAALPTCCYGCQMTANNWIQVEMAPGRRAASAPPYAVHVEGVLVVHPPDDELSPLYTMTADSSTATQQ